MIGVQRSSFGENCGSMTMGRTDAWQRIFIFHSDIVVHGNQ